MDKVRIVVARKKHLDQMLQIGLRLADANEVYHFSAASGASALTKSFNDTPATYVALLGSEPISMFGVRPLGIMTRDGVPWMLGTDTLDTQPLALGKISKLVFNCMCRDYDYLENYADNDNTKSLAWLAWLGFTVDPEPVQLGPFRHPFRRFYWRR